MYSIIQNQTAFYHKLMSTNVISLDHLDPTQPDPRIQVFWPDPTHGSGQWSFNSGLRSLVFIEYRHVYCFVDVYSGAPQPWGLREHVPSTFQNLGDRHHKKIWQAILENIHISTFV